MITGLLRKVGSWDGVEIDLIRKLRKVHRSVHGTDNQNEKRESYETLTTRKTRGIATSSSLSSGWMYEYA